MRRGDRGRLVPGLPPTPLVLKSGLSRRIVSRKLACDFRVRDPSERHAKNFTGTDADHYDAPRAVVMLLHVQDDSARSGFSGRVHYRVVLLRTVGKSFQLPAWFEELSARMSLQEGQSCFSETGQRCQFGFGTICGFVQNIARLRVFLVLGTSFC